MTLRRGSWRGCAVPGERSRRGARSRIVMKLAELRSQDESLAALLADQLINTALLRAGMLDDPAKLADNSQALLEKLLNK